MIIHLLGGIHEIYFPYILMNPVVIVAPILGNMAAILWYTITDCGLVGPASPGSIIAYLMVSPGYDLVKVLIGVVIAAGISFVVASPIVKMAGGRSLEEAQNEMASMKQAAKGETTVPGTIERSEEVKKSSSHAMQVWDLPRWEQPNSATGSKMTARILRYPIHRSIQYRQTVISQSYRQHLLPARKKQRRRHS